MKEKEKFHAEGGLDKDFMNAVNVHNTFDYSINSFDWTIYIYSPIPDQFMAIPY